MRLDYIAEFNGTAETFRTRLDEMIALKKVELARLEKVRNVVDGIASVEQMVADPTVNGDREAPPSIARPVEAAAETAPERRNGRPVVTAQSEQAAA